MSVLLYEKKGHIAYLTLNRPEVLNALNVELHEALAKAWADFNDDDELWVAVLTGAGDRAFCAGLDLKERARLESQGAAPRRQLPTLGEGLECWKPTIAAINGYCIAGGWMLAQRCDLRIACEDAQVGITEVKWGRSPWWVVDLPRIIGLGNALEVCLLGERMGAQRAYEMGFINKVVPRQELMTTATQWAEILCENAPLSVRGLKEVLYRGLTLTHDEGLALARHILAPVSLSEDAREGPRAFAEKRKPAWKAR